MFLINGLVDMMYKVWKRSRDKTDVAGFCRLLIFFFSKLIFSKKSFRNTMRVSNSLNPDQGRCIDLGHNG